MKNTFEIKWILKKCTIKIWKKELFIQNHKNQEIEPSIMENKNYFKVKEEIKWANKVLQKNQKNKLIYLILVKELEKILPL